MSSLLIALAPYTVVNFTASSLPKPLEHRLRDETVLGEEETGAIIAAVPTQKQVTQCTCPEVSALTVEEAVRGTLSQGADACCGYFEETV